MERIPNETNGPTEVTGRAIFEPDTLGAIIHNSAGFIPRPSGKEPVEKV